MNSDMHVQLKMAAILLFPLNIVLKQHIGLVHVMVYLFFFIFCAVLRYCIIRYRVHISNTETVRLINE